jgi:3-phenylpropionate/trans-cinnamate dioxygenase ferredoxin reductase component
MVREIVVIGGGPAAVFAAAEARKKDQAAKVTLVTDEACEPYEKPPLSKSVLLGKALPEDAPIAGPGGLAKHGVAVRLNSRCTAIDRPERRIRTTRGAFAYDALVIATGSRMRELPMLALGTPHVHYLRTEAQARAIKAALADCKQMVVIGAGLIGLEAAASAAELGKKVTVVEVEPRIMARACEEEIGRLILAEHERHGVLFKLSATVTRAGRRDDGAIALEINGGDDICTADLVLVGAGVKPDDALASAAGLAVQDGIIVDAQCRTSDPRIFAAGDVTRFVAGYAATGAPDGLVRLENWRHAQEQGAVAGRNAAGGNETYKTIPSYWSEQYGLYIQGVGWPDAAAERVRRPLPDKSALLLHIKDGVLAYAIGINAQRDLAIVRRLIERRIPIKAETLADQTMPLASMLKANA